MFITPINVQEPYLSFILSGQKTVEGRLNKGKFRDLRAGDNLAIGPIGQLFAIKEINHYDSFRDMIVTEGLKNVVPDKDSIDEAVAVCYRFYTKDEEEKFGVLALRLAAV